MTTRRCFLLPLMALAGCTLGPDFSKPDGWSPARWFDEGEAPKQPPALSIPVAEPIKADWWTVFGDAELTRLEQRAASANLDVRTATIRLAESREQRRITAADEFPQVNGDAAYSRQRPSPNGEFSLFSAGGSGGGAAGGSSIGGAAGVPSSVPLKPFDLYQYGFDASWEPDLWGKVRRAVESADANIEASAEARRDTLLSVMAEVARDYLQLRQIQAQLRIAHDNVAVSQDSVRLTSEQARKGLASQLDADTAAAQLSGVLATIPQLESREAAAINQLSFLIGDTPRSLADQLSTPMAIPPVPPRVPIGLPSELAERRPDIREAEATLHAATAEIGVAEAAFYPSLSLNGGFDLQAVKFADLGNWASRTYEIGPSLKIPIFQGGRLSGNLELTKQEQQAAAIAFQKTVLNAWTEIDDALVAYDREQRRLVQLERQTGETQAALGLARQQYANGVSDFLRVLDTQRQVLAAEQQEADSRATVSTDLVSLYKALGGGWDTPPA